MPDVWTNHPGLVRDLLKEAGFTCGVQPRFLKRRDPAWTCAFDGPNLRGDLYVHHVDRLRSELREPDDTPTPAAAAGAADGWTLAAAVLLLGVVLAGRLRAGGRARG